jgi:hypothetical protein
MLDLGDEASAAAPGERIPVEKGRIKSGSFIPGIGPISVRSSQGAFRRRIQRDMNSWWGLERTNDPRAFTRKDVAGSERRRKGSEYHRD